MSKRTDVHRPADLDPANYVEVGYTDAHPEEGISWLDRDVLDNLPGGEKWFTGHYTTRGGCDHCGHGSLRYAAHYLHEPTGEIVSVGLTCAGKLDLPDRDRLTMIEKAKAATKAEKIEALRREYPIALGTLDSYVADADAKTAARQEWWKRHGEQIDDGRGLDSFFFDSLSRQLRRKGELSLKQLRALARAAITSAERQAERDAEKAAEPETTSLPENLDERIEITGKILAVKFTETAYGTSEKMLVLDDRGFRVWGTRGEGMLAPTDPETDNGWIERDGVMHRPADKGDRVKFVARIEASDDDPAFGFYSRPTRYEYLGTPEVEAEEIDSDLRERAEAEIEKLDRRIEAIEAAAAIEACYEEAERENTDRAAAAMMGEVGRDVLDLYATETMALTYPISAEAAREEIARRQAAAPDPHARTETTEEEMDADEIAAVREEVAR